MTDAEGGASDNFGWVLKELSMVGKYICGWRV
jgi:hypothetical protein